MEAKESELKKIEKKDEELDPVDIEILLQGRGNDCCIS